MIDLLLMKIPYFFFKALDVGSAVPRARTEEFLFLFNHRFILELRYEKKLFNLDHRTKKNVRSIPLSFGAYRFR